ncbi:ATP-dependent DNA helicase Rep [Vibrio sp. 10N.286.49.C2]|uniref:DNA helicase Rep n=1 Tax=unclassified Vibrio TaxID=2614977 RepID=UPI000C85A5E5|nr:MULTISPECIES: DNA helicase Rep [unclassified Vibrio]PMH37310.1 ATP-dependent DNA helicase Rep [Vibrio sp. 10N.286.49.C2]PMH49398.1 ATP-dependent DNA helicase Rep [Vibrio sp. 10N.286.49.B1]PMH80780.1 ATP-dependent DNA helicase Rep [Vibrio sp. 10N.286.48.B7]
MKLNPQQDMAVKYVSGPCLVLAGAGSGKTRVITNKIAHLVQNCGYKARNIAAVTFTNKAAREMKERVGQTLGKHESKGLLVSTFHTMGLNIIRREYKALGLKAGFSLFDDQDQLALLKELTEDQLEGDKDLLRSLMSCISNWKNDMLSAEHVKGIARSEQEQLFAFCYDMYLEQMKAYNALDFDDLIAMPVVLLKNNEEVRQRWQKKIQYLLVDEYQDTNTSQYELVKLLVGERSRFTVVGDDDQSIYSWRGAKPQNLILLSKDYPSLKVVKLEQNYRSTSRILRAANILIANNPHIIEKSLFSEIPDGEKLKVLKAKNEDHEAERITGELIGHRFVNRTNYRDYAILYRGNHQSRLIEKVLMQNRVPYKISGGTSFFARAEIKDIMAYLRVLVNPADDNAFLRIVNTPRREIGPVTLQKLGSYANMRGKSLFEASFELGLEQHLSGRGLENLRRFTQWIVAIADNSERGNTVEAVRSLVRDIKYEDWLYETSSSAKAAEMRMKNVSDLYSWIVADLEGDNYDKEEKSLKEVVQRLTLRDMMERGEDDDDSDAVQLMTLHSSKGLEFPYVYLLGAEEGILPHQTSIDEENVEEERRLMYVGITRAQKELTFSLCKERRQYGELIKPEHSRFLDELPFDDIDWEQTKKPVSQEERMEKGQTHIANIRAMFNKK